MEIPFISLIFQGIPEMIAFSILILTINNDLKEWKKGILVGIFFAVALFFIRKLPISYGIHTLLITFLAVIVFKNFFDFNIFVLIKSILLGEVLIFIGEMISFAFLSKVLGYNISELVDNHVLWVVSGWPQIFLLLFVSYLFRNTKKRVKYNVK
ncbi:MAG: hypothetical protein JG764_2203 [Clostridiales bacterium]|nr:hypothetical protein [Clostridiales bacterium]